MLNKQDVARLVIAAAIFSAGCDKDKSGSSSTAGSGSAQTSAQSTAAGTTAGPTVSELVATYNAVSAVEGSDNKKHQALTLNADNTAALDTEIMVNGNPQKTIGSQHATGTYAVKGMEIAVDFTQKDGKAIPVSDKMHTMRLTSRKGDKSLLCEDGRTFERAK